MTVIEFLMDCCLYVRVSFLNESVAECNSSELSEILCERSLFLSVGVCVTRCVSMFLSV